MKGRNLWRLVYLAIPLTAAVFAAILLANEWRNARPPQSVGRVPEAVRYAAEAEAVKEEAAEYRLDSYTEGDGPAPEWYRPDEPMAAEWVDCLLTSNSHPTQIQVSSKQLRGKSEEEASCGQVTEANKEAGSGDSGELSQGAEQVKDIGCPDWNADSAVTGWDGRRAEAWELDLYARIMYLEFWGCSPECCEAGADSMLRLWESGYFGPTLGGVLSAVTETGAYCYSTYPAVWATEYDPDGLAEMRALCAERFAGGPEWDAAFFQLGGYPDWACPMYQVDNVFFSTGWGW